VSSGRSEAPLERLREAGDLALAQTAWAAVLARPKGLDTTGLVLSAELPEPLRRQVERLGEPAKVTPRLGATPLRAIDLATNLAARQSPKSVKNTPPRGRGIRDTTRPRAHEANPAPTESESMSMIGTGAPTTLGVDGEYYLDVASGGFYVKHGGAWTQQGTLPPWRPRGADISFDSGSVGIGPLAPQDALLQLDGGPLRIINTSKFESALIGSFTPDVAGANLHSIHVEHGRAYLAYGTAGLIILDVTTPASVTKLGSYLEDGLDVVGVHVKDDKAYVACGTKGLRVLDIASPSAIKKTASPALEGGGPTAMVVHGRDGRLYVAHGTTLLILDGELKIIGRFQSSDPLLGFAIHGGHVDASGARSASTAYLNHGAKLRALDLTNVSLPTERWSHEPIGSDIVALAVDEGRLLLGLASANTSAPSGALEIFDLIDPARQTPSATLTTSYRVKDIAGKSNTVVYVVGAADATIEVVGVVASRDSLSARSLQLVQVDGLRSATIDRLVVAPNSDYVYLKTSAGELRVVRLVDEGRNAVLEGRVEILGELFLRALGKGPLIVSEEGRVEVDQEAELVLWHAENYEKNFAPWVRTVFGEAVIYLATTTGKTILKCDWRGLPTATIRTLLNLMKFGEGREHFKDLNLDAFATSKLFAEDLDGIATLTAIGGNAFDIALIKKSLGWKVDNDGGTWFRELWDTPLSDWTLSKVFNPGPNSGFPRQLGHYIDVQHNEAVVVGSGRSGHPISDGNSAGVFLGAGSDVPSIVVRPGTVAAAGGPAGQAGSVAIGHQSVVDNTHRSIALGRHTATTASDAMVIGSGVDAAHPLTASVVDSIVVGAASDIPSMVISPGAGPAVAGGVGTAGTVAIGGFTDPAAAANAVVIGSGVDANNRLSAQAQSVILGARSTVPSIVIAPSAALAAAGPAGTIAIGGFTDPVAANAVVIGSGVDANNPLPSIAQSIVLGAGSTLASIVVSPGAGPAAVGGARAGSVAIGHGSVTDASANRSLALGTLTSVAANEHEAVVIGSGFTPPAIGAVAAPLQSAGAHTVVIGAGSNEASLVVSVGAQDQAGSVAIGSKTSAAGQANAVVIGSGLAAGAGGPLNAQAGAVVIGAHSNVASIVVQHGGQGVAGSVAIGGNASANQADAVVISAGPGALLGATANSVVLGAGGHTALVIDQNQIVVHQTIVPALHNTIDIGAANNRFRDAYLSPRSLHIGEEGAEAVISYQADKNRLAVQAESLCITGKDGARGFDDLVIGLDGITTSKKIDATEIVAKTVSITGLTRNDGSNYLVLGSDNKVACVPGTDSVDAAEAKQQADKAKVAADEAKREVAALKKYVESAGVGEVKSGWQKAIDDAKAFFGTAKTAIDTLETITTVGATKVAVDAAALAVGSAGAASGAAAAAVGSAGAALASMTGAGLAAADAKSSKEGAATAANAATKLVSDATTAVTTATENANKALGDAKTEAIAAAKSYGDAKEEATAAAKSYDEAKKEATGAAKSYGEAKEEATAAAKSYGEAKEEATAAAKSYGEAKKEATGAAKSYDEAKKEATSAAKSYDEAKKEATGAAKSYDEAKKEATGAAKSYGEAKKSYTDATGATETAQKAYAHAAGEADAARSSFDASTKKAELAEGAFNKAEAARGSVQSAKTAAETAQSKAEDAQRLAEAAARTAAQSAQQKFDLVKADIDKKIATACGDVRSAIFSVGIAPDGLLAQQVQGRGSISLGRIHTFDTVERTSPSGPVRIIKMGKLEFDVRKIVGMNGLIELPLTSGQSIFQPVALSLELAKVENDATRVEAHLSGVLTVDAQRRLSPSGPKRTCRIRVDYLDVVDPPITHGPPLEYGKRFRLKAANGKYVSKFEDKHSAPSWTDEYFSTLGTDNVELQFMLPPNQGLPGGGNASIAASAQIRIMSTEAGLGKHKYLGKFKPDCVYYYDEGYGEQLWRVVKLVPSDGPIHAGEEVFLVNVSSGHYLASRGDRYMGTSEQPYTPAGDPYSWVAELT
jgi:hypothetical protein